MRVPEVPFGDDRDRLTYPAFWDVSRARPVDQGAPSASANSCVSRLMTALKS